MKRFLILIGAVALVATTGYSQISGGYPSGGRMNRRYRPPTLPYASGDFVLVEQSGQNKAGTVGGIAQSNGVNFTTVVANVNLSATGATNIPITIPTGQKFYAVSARVESTTVTAITVGANVQFGSTGTSGTSIVAAVALSSAPVVSTYEILTIKNQATAIAPGDTIQFNVNTAATGTSQIARVHLIGYFQ